MPAAGSGSHRSPAGGWRRPPHPLTLSMPAIDHSELRRSGHLTAYVPPALGLLCLLVSPAAAAAQATAPAEPTHEVQPAETRLRFYGFVGHEVIFDDSRIDAAQSAQLNRVNAYVTYNF